MSHREALVKPFLTKRQLLTLHEVFAGLKLRTTPKHPLANATRLIRALGKTHPSVRVRRVLTRAPETGAIKHPQPPSQQGAPAGDRSLNHPRALGKLQTAREQKMKRQNVVSGAFCPELFARL